MKAPIKGYIFVAVSSLILGTNGIFARFIDLPSPVLLFYRFLFGALVMTLFFIIKEKNIPLPRTDKKQILILGFVGTITSILAFYSFNHTTIANAEILLYTSPIYVVILAPLFL